MSIGCGQNDYTCNMKICVTRLKTLENFHIPLFCTILTVSVERHPVVAAALPAL